jgi:hypothetical protein
MFLKVKHVIITHSYNKVCLSLHNVRKDLKRSIIVEEREGKDPIFAGIVVTDTCDVWLGKNERRAGR